MAEYKPFINFDKRIEMRKFRIRERKLGVVGSNPTRPAKIEIFKKKQSFLKVG